MAYPSSSYHSGTTQASGLSCMEKLDKYVSARSKKQVEMIAACAQLAV